ncbi:MAG TPA: aminotransferase class I/II-fold pyridoxal phosphate-dependent enzyme, partial [Egibacteraceae bacterium]
MWDADEYVRAAGLAAQRVATANAAAQRGETPVVDLAAPARIADELDLDGRLARGMGTEDLGAFLDAYLARSTRLHHPASLAHQVAVPDVGAALGDLVHGAINNPMAVYEMGPSAATVELVVVNRLLAAVGFCPQPLDGRDDGTSGAGVLTSGGSLANLTALLAARAATAPDAWEDGVPGDLVVLVPPTSHYSVARAVAIMGLGARAVRSLPVGRHGVVDPDGVAATIAAVRREGRRPLAVVVNAPSTATGLHDPLRAVAEVCRTAGAWLHVDAAHGATALLSPRERHHLDGIDLADSVTWDAHKMLRTAGLCAAVLFRRARSFDTAFSEEASYLFYDDEADRGPGGSQG